MSDFLNIEALADAIASKIKVAAPITQRVYSLDAAAEYCGMSRDAFKKKAVRDKIRKVRLDKNWRFDRADLDEWIERHKEPPRGCIDHRRRIGMAFVSPKAFGRSEPN